MNWQQRASEGVPARLSWFRDGGFLGNSGPLYLCKENQMNKFGLRYSRNGVGTIHSFSDECSGCNVAARPEESR